MSKKHYVAIAKAFRANAETLTGENSVWTDGEKAGAKVAQCALAQRLADVFASENPKFDRARFLQACGV